MVVECSCGEWHSATPTALAVIIRASQEGELHTVSRDGIKPVCLLNAFTPEAIDYTAKRYPGRNINYG